MCKMSIYFSKFICKLLKLSYQERKTIYVFKNTNNAFVIEEFFIFTFKENLNKLHLKLNFIKKILRFCI